MAAALDNGTLLVNRSSPVHHHIASVRAMLRRQGHEIQREYLVDLDVIRKAYENAARRVQGSASRIDGTRSEEHTSELQSLMRISYAVFCLKKHNINCNSKHIFSSIQIYSMNDDITEQH